MAGAQVINERSKQSRHVSCPGVGVPLALVTRRVRCCLNGGAFMELCVCTVLWLWGGASWGHTSHAGGWVNDGHPSWVHYGSCVGPALTRDPLGVHVSWGKGLPCTLTRQEAVETDI